jgi:hypothetical protein
MNSTVDSNSVGLYIGEETSLKVLNPSTVLFELEPNNYSTFGAEYKSVSRDPITKGRQRKKGTIVDMDASASFDMDVTSTNTRRLMQGFMFANAVQKASTRPLNGTAATLTTVAASDDSVNGTGMSGFAAGQLVVLKGFTTANNGLKTIVSASATKLTFSEALSDEASVYSYATVEVVGRVCGSGDITIANNTTSVSLGSTVLDFTTLGLVVGEYIYIGGDTESTSFSSTLKGYARIQSIATRQLVLDDTTFQPATSNGAGKTIQLFFGSTIRNEVEDSKLVRKTYHIERQLGKDGNGVQAEYLTGSIANDFTLNLSEAAKVDANLSYVCLGHETRSTTEGLKSNTRWPAPLEDAFNSTSNLYRAKLAIASGLNPTPVFAYGSEMKLTIKNGVKSLKALGVLGGFEASAGTFEVSATMEAYFSEIGAISAISDNDDVSLSVIATKDNSGFVFDMPMTSLGGGQLKVNKNDPIKLSLNIDAAQCANGYTLMTTFFPYLPTAAMATA